MPEYTKEQNIVEELRSITEKEDMKQYLKSKWGGYTKESVLEYLNVLRRQQQIMSETFSRNQQVLYDEKERLKSSNDTLKNRLRQAEIQYKNLSEAMRGNQLDQGTGNLSDIVALKNSIAAMEADLEQSRLEKSKLQKHIELQDAAAKELEHKAEQSEQEKLSIKEMLTAQMQESKKYRDQVMQLSGELEEKNREIKFVNSIMTEGELAKLSEKIDQLTAQLQEQTEAMAKCNRQNDTKTQTIEMLKQENLTLRDNLVRLTDNLEEMNEQNDKLLLAGQSLSDQLELEYKKSLALIREKSFLIMEKLTAGRKLDQAGGKIALLELEIRKQKEGQEKKLLPQSGSGAETDPEAD